MSKDSIRPSNKPEHIKARREAGLTGCMDCKDSGYLTRSWSAGAGRIGCRVWSVPCGCSCSYSNQLVRRVVLNGGLEHAKPCEQCPWCKNNERLVNAYKSRRD